MGRPLVLALVGPTGVGKTEIAAGVARRTGAEIISADSMQVYRRLDIGTAKPSAQLRAELPHHLIDVVDPDDSMSAGRYAALARDAARSIAERGRPVLLCGGSGLYARAFARGLIGGVASDPAVRAELETRATDELYDELAESDPASAERLAPGDRVRIVRALEVLQLGGEPISSRHVEHGFEDQPFDVRWLGLELDRGELEQRIRARVDRMFADGLVEEVKGLHAAGYSAELRSLQAIGYREVGRLLAGELDERETREAIAIATRRYAKRQLTWFRAEPGLEWIDASDPARVLREAEARISSRSPSPR